MTKGPQRVEDMIKSLRSWQSIERQAMEDTALILEKTDNQMIRIIMEVIRADSLMHHRVQQVIIDSLNKENITLTHDDIAAVWGEIQAHDAHEKDVIKIATELREKAWTPVHKVLLQYLLTSEQVHDQLLEQLGEIKKEMSKGTN
ncbi:MAG: hypothetical protein ABIJ09_17775 [Pseudomonadota bacterium]